MSPAEDKEWLQPIVELNAMMPADLIQWLDEKFARFTGKVIPPDEVIAGRVKDDAKQTLWRKC